LFLKFGLNSHVHRINVPFGRMSGSRARAREPLNNELTDEKNKQDLRDLSCGCPLSQVEIIFCFALSYE